MHCMERRRIYAFKVNRKQQDVPMFETRPFGLQHRDALIGSAVPARKTWPESTAAITETSWLADS